MTQLIIILVLSIALMVVLAGWRQDRRLLSKSRKGPQDQNAEKTTALEKANENLKTAQAELQRRWQYLAEAQRLSHSGTFGWKVRSGELVWSDETYRILGLTRETNPTLDLAFDRIHPEDLDRVRQLSDRAAENGMDLDVEHRILLPDGAVRYVKAVAHAGRDSSGNLEYMGVVTDITERKLAEEEREALSRDLQESKAWLEEAQRVAHLGYWVWDLPTNHLIWSDETYRIFGLSPQEGLIDLDKVREMIHPDDRENVFRTAEEAVRSGTRADCEHRLFRPNGEMRVVHSLADLKRDASGRPHKMFGTTQDITERKRAEEELQLLYRDLQESKASLEEAQSIAHIGSWVWDLEKNHVAYSDEYYRIFGLTPTKGPIDIAIVREMIHPEDREYVFRIAEEAISSGERADCEHRIVRPDGEIRIVHSLGDLKKDASGRPYEMYGVSQDVTDRRRAEEALRRSQFYLSEGERLAHIGSWAFNDSGHYWSDELYKIYGLDQQKVAPTVEQYLALVHPQDRAMMSETIRRMQEEHCGFDQIERIIRPDGQLRYIRAVAVPVFEKQVFKGFVGTTIDVTDQELLTRELRREKAYLAEAQSLSHIGSWASNLATMHNFHLSDETYRIHGFDPHQGPIPLERFWATLHPEDEAEVRTAIEDAVRAGTDYDVGDFRICRADDGQIRFLRTIGHRNPSSEPGEYLGITMDITERKHAEQEREKLRKLEADLAHINRINMMGELAAALAHEIKQPIAASITNANALSRWLAHNPPDLERARAAATRIEQEGNRAADVINNLRSFYKKGAPAKRRIVDVKDIIREITVLLGDEALRHSVTMRSELYEHVPDILADRVQLQQVFMNLMLNAIEAMKETGGELTIRSGLNQEGQLLISISDTGVGLPLENTERIFDAFHTTKPQGTGMGLAITRSILESHGGRIWATPNQGAGATFHFTLPVEAEAHA
jgi:PAS domain S-box-containing protein